MKDEFNKKTQEYKKCKVIFVDKLDLEFKVKPSEIIIEPKQKPEKYNRAKNKREFKKRIDEESMR